jgi:stage II sporulation protein AA (anti-sigma F factor antagonist)
MSVDLKPIEEAETHTTLALKGNLDMAGAWEIERMLFDYISVDMRHMLVDMSAVEFLGSMGIRVFVRSASALQRAKKKLVLFAAQPLVEKTLTVSGFTSVIPLVPTLKDAKAAIGV